MTKQRKIRRRFASGLQSVMLIALLLLISGCRTKKIPQEPAHTQKPAYRGEVRAQIQPLAKQVDDFYMRMLGQQESQRQYETYRQQYSGLETEISKLLQPGEREPLNAQARELAVDIFGLWKQRREEHAREKTLSDGLIQLNRVDFEDMFQTLFMLQNRE